MSQADKDYVVFIDDTVANETLALLEEEKKVRNVIRLVRGTPVPEGSVHIVHRPNQDGYVEVKRSVKRFVVYVRASSQGDIGRLRKARRRIPTLVDNLEDVDGRRYALA